MNISKQKEKERETERKRKREKERETTKLEREIFFLSVRSRISIKSETGA